MARRLEQLAFAPNSERFRSFQAPKDTGIRSVEVQPQKHPVVVVTGSSRGIGAEIVKELALKHHAIVIGLHRDPGKEPRANKAVDEIRAAGGTMINRVCDITDQKATVRVIQDVMASYGLARIDTVILNAAGGMERLEGEENMDPAEAARIKRERAFAINSESKVALIDELSSRFDDSPNAEPPLVIDNDSLWSWFYTRGIKQLPEYEQTAESKDDGTRRLRETVDGLNQGRQNKIKLACVVSHGVDGTFIIRGFRHRYPEEMARAAATAIEGKLPTMEHVAQAFGRVLANRNKIQDGHIEWVGIPILDKNGVAEQLPLFDPEKKLELDGAVLLSGENIFAYRTVAEKDTLPHFPDGLVTLDLETGDGILDVTHQHAEGHFLPLKSQDPTKSDIELSLLRGVDGIARLMDTVQARVQSGKLIPRRIHRPIEFNEPIIPGDRVIVKDDVTYGDSLFISARGTLEVNGLTAVRIPMIEFDVVTGFSSEPQPVMTLPRMIEGAAQAVGLAILNKQRVDKIQTINALHAKMAKGQLTPDETRQLTRLESPDNRQMAALFRGVRENIEYRRPVNIGEIIEYDARIEEVEDARGKAIVGNVVVRVGDEVVGVIPGIDCVIAPAAVIKRQIDRSVARRRSA